MNIMSTNNIDRFSQAEKAAHWLTETLEDLNRQAASYGELVHSLEEAKSGLTALQSTTENAIASLQQQIMTLDTLKSGEFIDRVSILSENLARAQVVFDEALNRITAFIGDYTSTHQTLFKTSQEFVEEGKKLYLEVKNLADTFPIESEKMFTQLQEKLTEDVGSLNTTFQSATDTFSQLFRSFEEKLLSTQALLDRLLPLGRSVTDEFAENLEKAISDINNRLNIDQENLLTRHQENNQSLLSNFTSEMKAAGEILSTQIVETTRQSREEWEALFTSRTEEIKNAFSAVQNTLLQLEKNIQDQSENTNQKSETLRSDITQAIETINQTHQSLVSILETLPTTLQGISEQTLTDFKERLNTVLKETERDWLTEINTTRDQQIQELTTTKKDILDAVSGTSKGIVTNRYLLIFTIIISAVAIVMALIK
jgi:hypothetical protein